MAKIAKSVSFEKAQINMKDRTITEYLKDETNTYKLDDIFKDWDGVDGITFSIKQVDKLAANENSDEGTDE
jgi:hypothetical protein